MPTLYDEIAEAQKILNLTEKESDDGEDNESGVREDRPVRGRSGQQQGEPTGEGAVQELGGTGERGTSEGSPRNEGGTSSGDERASRRQQRASRESGKDAQSESDGTQKDGRTSQEDGEALLETEKQPTNADFARMRRETRELRAKLAKLEAEKTAPAEVKKEEPKQEVKETKVEATKEPDKNENYQAWLEWKLQQQDNTIQEQAKLTKDYQDWKAEETQKKEQERLTNAAIEEFTRIEDAYKAENPDYGNAIEFARQKYLDAAKIFYPDKTEKQIEEAIDKQMLGYASAFAAKGLNPAEELYDLVVERFGYQKAAKEEVADEKPAPKQEVRRPNLRIVNENRKRSATPLGTGGQSGSIPITKEVAADMSLGEFSRLTPEDLINLENMG